MESVVVGGLRDGVARPTPEGRPIDPGHLLNVVGTLRPEHSPQIKGRRLSAGERTRTELLAEAAFSDALGTHNAGDLLTAKALYRKALTIEPMHYRAARFLSKIMVREGAAASVWKIFFTSYAHYAGPKDEAALSIFQRAGKAMGRKLPRQPTSSSAFGKPLSREYFYPVEDVDLAKVMFKRSVNSIDLELFSYCNRRCLYCPNVAIDRYTSKSYLNGDIYRKVIRDLSEIDYGGKITLNLYNEPLSDPVTIEACREMRRMIPNAFLRCNTNGDYLRENTFERLRNAGLNHLMISLHVSKTLAWDDEKVQFRAEQIYKRTNRRPEEIRFKPGRSYSAEIPFDGLKITVQHGNYNEFGYNIGGLMKEIPAPSERTSPCIEPFNGISIMYNGEITPCCRIRGDAEAHAAYRCGNMADYTTIFEAWTGEHFASWRRHMLGFNAKSAPCDTCVASCMTRTTESEALHAAAATLIDPEDRPSW